MTDTIQKVKATKQLRPSFANLVATCTGAFYGQDDEFSIDWAGDAAGKVGSALHVAAKDIVNHEEVLWDDITKKYGLTRNLVRDLHRLAGFVYSVCSKEIHSGAWDTQRIITEQRLDGKFETEHCIYDVGGTIDVGGFSADHTIWQILDWKTTRIESQEVLLVEHDQDTDAIDIEIGGENSDYHAQQMFYLWLMKKWIQKHLPREQWPQYYQYQVGYARDWTHEISPAYTAEELDAWMAGFFHKIETWDRKEYRPGPLCHYCPRQIDCPAIWRYVTAAARAVQSDEMVAAAETASDDELVLFKIAAQVVEGKLKTAKDLLKAIVVGRGGEIASSHGVLVTTPVPRYNIDPIKAWPLCEAELSTEELAEATTLSKMKLLDAIGDHAPKGQKGKAKEAFWEELQEADAVEQQDSLQLRYKKAKLITKSK